MAEVTTNYTARVKEVHFEEQYIDAITVSPASSLVEQLMELPVFQKVFTALGGKTPQSLRVRVRRDEVFIKLSRDGNYMPISTEITGDKDESKWGEIKRIANTAIDAMKAAARKLAASATVPPPTTGGTVTPPALVRSQSMSSVAASVASTSGSSVFSVDASVFSPDPDFYEELSERCEETEAEIATLTATIASLEGKIENRVLKQQVKALASQLEEAQEQLASAKLRIEMHNVTRDTLAGREFDARMEAADLKREVEQLKALLGKTKTDTLLLIDRMTEEFRAAALPMQEELLKARQTIQDLEDKALFKDRLLTDLASSHRDTQSALDEAKAETVALRSVLAETEGAFAAERRKLQREIAIREKELAKAQEDINALTAVKEGMHEDAQEAEVAFKASIAAHEAILKRQKERSAFDQAEHTRELEESEAKIIHLKGVAEEAHARYEKALEELECGERRQLALAASFKEEHASLQATATQQMAALEEKIGQGLLEIQRLQAALKAETQARKMAESRTAYFQRDAADARSLRTRVEKLEVALKEEQAKRRQAEMGKHFVQGRYEALRAKLVEKEAALLAAEETAEKDALKDQRELTKLRAEVVVLRAKVQQAFIDGQNSSFTITDPIPTPPLAPTFERPLEALTELAPASGSSAFALSARMVPASEQLGIFPQTEIREVVNLGLTIIDAMNSLGIGLEKTPLAQLELAARKYIGGAVPNYEHLLEFIRLTAAIAQGAKAVANDPEETELLLGERLKLSIQDGDLAELSPGKHFGAVRAHLRHNVMFLQLINEKMLEKRFQLPLWMQMMAGSHSNGLLSAALMPQLTRPTRIEDVTESAPAEAEESGWMNVLLGALEGLAGLADLPTIIPTLE